MRLIGYVRGSKETQEITLEAQSSKVSAMATVKGYPLMEIVADSESAKDLERPGIKRVLAMVDAKEIDGVVVAKLDRITRSVKDLAHLMDQFQRNGVSLISVEESLDTGSASGRLVLNIMVSVSQWEREAIGERTRTALEQNKKSGFPTSHAPFGWTSQDRPMGPNGKKLRMSLLPNEAEQHTIRVIRDLNTKGESLRAIADALNAAGYRTRKGGNWHFTAVGRVLREHGQAESPRG